MIKLIRKLEKCVPEARENLENWIVLVGDLGIAVRNEDLTAIGGIIERSTIQMEEALEKIDIPELKTGILTILDLNAELLTEIEGGNATMRDVLELLRQVRVILTKSVKACKQ